MFAAMTPPEPDLHAILSHDGLSGKEQIEQLALGLLGTSASSFAFSCPWRCIPDSTTRPSGQLPLERLQLALVEALEAKRRAGRFAVRTPEWWR